MELTDFIDFSVFAELDDTWDDDGDFFICEKDPNHQYYVSQDIEGVDRSEGIKMIRRAKKSFESYTKISNSYITKHVEKNYIRDKCFYKSDDKKYYCFFIYLDYEEDTIYMCGLLDRKNSKYLTIGSFAYIN